MDAQRAADMVEIQQQLAIGFVVGFDRRDVDDRGPLRTRRRLRSLGSGACGVSPRAVKAAASVRSGHTFSLAVPLSADEPQLGRIPGRTNPRQTMLAINDPMSGNGIVLVRPAICRRAGCRSPRWR